MLMASRNRNYACLRCHVLSRSNDNLTRKRIHYTALMSSSYFISICFIAISIKYIVLKD